VETAFYSAHPRTRRKTLAVFWASFRPVDRLGQTIDASLPDLEAAASRGMFREL